MLIRWSGKARTFASASASAWSRSTTTYADVATVLAAADAACYAAKHAGRNRVRSGGSGLRLVRDGAP